MKAVNLCDGQRYVDVNEEDGDKYCKNQCFYGWFYSSEMKEYYG